MKNISSPAETSGPSAAERLLIVSNSSAILCGAEKGGSSRSRGGEAWDEGGDGGDGGDGWIWEGRQLKRQIRETRVRVRARARTEVTEKGDTEERKEKRKKRKKGPEPEPEPEPESVCAYRCYCWVLLLLMLLCQYFAAGASTTHQTPETRRTLDARH